MEFPTVILFIMRLRIHSNITNLQITNGKPYRFFPSSFFLLSFFLLSSAHAQTDTSNFLKPVSDSILKEGIALYECAVASKLSSEFVIEKLSVEDISGFLTYKKNNSVYCVFLKGNPKSPEVRYTISFPAPWNPDNRNLDAEPRPLSDYESSIFKMRNKIFKMAKKRKSFFTNYSGIVLIPLFMQKENLTYIYLISNTRDDSFIPLGNDYLLVFDENTKLISKQKIHQNLIEIPFVPADTLNTDEALSSFHIHSELSAPFITATDICTLLLNAQNEKSSSHPMESHVVVSQEYVSFFFTAVRQLEIITREEYEKMNNEKKE